MIAVGVVEEVGLVSLKGSPLNVTISPYVLKPSKSPLVPNKPLPERFE